MKWNKRVFENKGQNVVTSRETKGKKKQVKVRMGRNWRGKNHKVYLCFSNPLLLLDRGTSDFHWCKAVKEQRLGD